jgi:hypothetical protein
MISRLAISIQAHCNAASADALSLGHTKRLPQHVPRAMPHLRQHAVVVSQSVWGAAGGGPLARGFVCRSLPSAAMVHRRVASELERAPDTSYASPSAGPPRTPRRRSIIAGRTHSPRAAW